MNTDSWSFDEGYIKIKTARQKRRLLLEERDRQLLKVYKRQRELNRQKAALSPVLLEEPYQKGWVRFYVLRFDVAISKHAAFYTSLLKKINTELYSPDKSYKMLVKRNRKKMWIDKPQSLKEFRGLEWEKISADMNEREKMLFYPMKQYIITKYNIESITKMVFLEPWRFVLRIRPNIITHRKGFDEMLDSQIGELNNYVERNGLQGKISHLRHGRSYNHWRDPSNPRFANPLKNIPLHQIICEAKENLYNLQPVDSDWL